VSGLEQLASTDAETPELPAKWKLHVHLCHSPILIVNRGKGNNVEKVAHEII
jgi:hypothetical protein